MNILIVDDHEINRTVLLLILQHVGYQADMASNGLEALQAAKNKAYQLIFMDIDMPVMDGITTAKEILVNDDVPPVIIAVTANTAASHKRRCLDAGMADFIEKPIGLQKIKRIMNQFFPAGPIHVDSRRFTPLTTFQPAIPEE